MKRGKQTCRILKEIRKQIAEANDIEFVTSECQYQGDCLGTCPKCESEVRYLEQQLEYKRIAGKTITILGISAGAIAMTTPLTSCTNTANKGTTQENVSETTIQDSVLLGEPRIVTDEDSIVLKGLTPPIVNRSRDTIESVEGLVGDIVAESPENDISENDTFDIVEKIPHFPGGQQALMEFLDKNLERLPPVAQGDGNQGRVIVQVVIGKDGSVVNPQIARGVDPYLDKEALRVVKLMPKWEPGVLNGKKVAVKFYIPVVFKHQ